MVTPGVRSFWFSEHVDGLNRPAVNGAASPPRLFCAPRLRYVELSGRLVVLDLSAGTYDVVDGVGAMMWQQLLRDPDERDLVRLADECGVSAAVIEADFVEFAATQQEAGWLIGDPPRTATPPTVVKRRRPTISRALRERARAQRDLRQGFSEAYAARTATVSDTHAPRVPAERVLQLFRTADGMFPARQAPLDCLPRSLALTNFLRMSGWQAEHRIGVALHPFEAHAWVELDGRAVDETPSVLARYAVIARA